MTTPSPWWKEKVRVYYYTIRDSILMKDLNVKFLGVTHDGNLTFNDHVNMGGWIIFNFSIVQVYFIFC